MIGLCIISVVLLIIIIVLLFKIMLFHKAIEEVSNEMNERLIIDTNTLITVSSRNRYIMRLAADLNTQLRLLRKERRKLQNGDMELKEAITNISHDLRTPLTAICGYLDLLEQEEKSEVVNRYFEIIKERTTILKQLTEELFRYSYITSVNHEMIYENVLLNRVLEESLSSYYATLIEHNITPEISISEKRIQCNINKSALSRIIGNIISNAIKYSDGDLYIKLLDDGEMVFTNSASMLDEIQVGKLFDRFYTVEAASKSTGLGLTIAKALTEQMNGKISATYEEGRLSIHLTF